MANASTINTGYLAGATLTAGDGVYLAANNKWAAMQANGTALQSGYGATVTGVDFSVEAIRALRPAR